jgi:hypothetical protein
VTSRRTGYDADCSSAPSPCSLDANFGEAMVEASFHEGGGLFVGPSMAGMTSRSWPHRPLHGDQTTTGQEYSSYLSKSGVDVRPVMHGRDRPCDESGRLGQRDRLSGTPDVPNLCPVSGENPCCPHHDGRWIDSGDLRPQTSSVADGDSGPAPDVHDRVTGFHTAQAYGKPRVALATKDHAERGSEPGDTGKAGVVGVVIGRRLLFVHIPTLTVEPNFKSSGVHA